MRGRFRQWWTDSPFPMIVLIFGVVGGAMVGVFLMDQYVSVRSVAAERVALSSALAVWESVGEDVIGQVVEFNRRLAVWCRWAFVPGVSDRWCSIAPLPVPRD